MKPHIHDGWISRHKTIQQSEKRKAIEIATGKEIRTSGTKLK